MVEMCSDVEICFAVRRLSSGVQGGSVTVADSLRSSRQGELSGFQNAVAPTTMEATLSNVFGFFH